MSASRNEGNHMSPNSKSSSELIEANVVVNHVSKRYVIRQNRSDDARVAKAKNGSFIVDAVVDASLVARPGESIGLIGVNGSGKSTLLSMIAGGQAPTSGRILTRSKPTLMGVSPALQPGLSGERNIFLGCLALGMRPEQARENVAEIAEWTELGEAIKRPMQTYSSGMAARLAFAISTAIKPEILLIDEALSTGDAAFATKATERMEELLDRAGNLFLVSHSLGQVEKTCKRVIWIHQGRIIADGSTQEISPKYHEWARLLGKENKGPAHEYLAEVAKAYKKVFIQIEEDTTLKLKDNLGLYT